MTSYGFHERIPYYSYAAIHALNFSTLKHMARSPLSYLHHRDHKSEPTDAMRLGTAAHTAILEPTLLGTEIVVWSGGRRFGKEWDAFCADHAGKTILKPDEFAAVTAMTQSVRAYEPTRKYLGPIGQSEVTMIWRDKAAERDMKGRVDRLTHVDGAPVIVDLKSCVSCQPFVFGNQAFKLGYYIQCAMYADGYFYLTGQRPKVVIIAVEKKPPYETAVFTLNDDVLALGHEEYARLVLKLADCEQSGIWSPALETETELSLPSYAWGPDESDDLGALQLVADED